MSVSKVYFTDMRCKVGTSLLEKLDKLMIAAGIGETDFENKFVAIRSEVHTSELQSQFRIS